MADEATENQEPQQPAAKPGSSKGKLFLFIPVILIAQAAIAYFLVGHFLAAEPEKPKPPPKKKPNEQPVGLFFEVKDVVVNPAGTLGRRYLVFEMGLETDDPKLVEEAQAKIIWIRDAIISLLVQKTSQELLDISKREALKQELLETVNRNLSQGKFKKLYITKYIMQ